jgi:hypothetical protein
MEKITPQPASNDAKESLKWLSEEENNSLRDDGLTDIVRLLISKLNQLSGEVDYLRNRINQLDSFH